MRITYQNKTDFYFSLQRLSLRHQELWKTVKREIEEIRHEIIMHAHCSPRADKYWSYKNTGLSIVCDFPDDFTVNIYCIEPMPE